MYGIRKHMYIYTHTHICVRISLDGNPICPVHGHVEVLGNRQFCPNEAVVILVVLVMVYVYNMRAVKRVDERPNGPKIRNIASGLLCLGQGVDARVGTIGFAIL